MVVNKSLRLELEHMQEELWKVKLFVESLYADNNRYVAQCLIYCIRL